MTTEIRRSKNSYARAPRSVTFAPTVMPSRSFHCETDFRDSVGTAFWPAIWVRLWVEDSRSFLFSMALPRPIESVTFWSLGSARSLDTLSRALSFGTTSFR